MLIRIYISFITLGFTLGQHYHPRQPINKLTEPIKSIFKQTVLPVLPSITYRGVPHRSKDDSEVHSKVNELDFSHDDNPNVQHAVTELSNKDFQTQAPATYRNEPYNHNHEYHNVHPAYEFKYIVEDKLHKDIKSHQEVRNGDVVFGTYALLQPDGYTRTVQYTANHHEGFHAHVTYIK